ncbi:MAG: sugar transferase [Pseudomonadota bacterium]
MSDRFGLLAKRCVDILLATVGIVVLSPLLLGVAIAIRLTSKGPVFYRGIRSGRFGRKFRVFKFRTMIENAEQVGGPSTGQNDPRVTRVGGFLRKFKIDELPNLINVLRGEMSIVGPRPEVPRYTDQYVGEEKIILSVRPGITDLSSIEFIDLASHIGAEDVDATFEREVLPRKNALRVRYVKTRTFWGDIKIIYMTLLRMVRRGR